jgi:hypothetical protein
MGIFSKTPKPNPKITIEGIEIAFHQEYAGWAFTYRGTDFLSFKPTLTLPTKLELDFILDTLESLKPEIRTRLQKGLSEWGDGSKLEDGESYSVNVQEFSTDKSFTVSWSDGASWGDLGVDITIKDHAIIDESWGD